MQSAENKNYVIVKLDDGADLFASLKEVVREHEIRSGIFLGGVGMLREFEIGYWTGREYVTRFYDTPHELIHFGGSIAQVDGEAMFHIHCAVAGPDLIVNGGHVKRGKVAVLNEITILKLTEVHLTRELNPSSGLMELKILR